MSKDGSEGMAAFVVPGAGKVKRRGNKPGAGASASAGESHEDIADDGVVPGAVRVELVSRRRRRGAVGTLLDDMGGAGPTDETRRRQRGSGLPWQAANAQAARRGVGVRAERQLAVSLDDRRGRVS